MVGLVVGGFIPRRGPRWRGAKKWSGRAAGARGEGRGASVRNLGRARRGRRVTGRGGAWLRRAFGVRRTVTRGGWTIRCVGDAEANGVEQAWTSRLASGLGR